MRVVGGDLIRESFAGELWSGNRAFSMSMSGWQVRLLHLSSRRNPPSCALLSLASGDTFTDAAK
jgi:hypothetical protein